MIVGLGTDLVSVERMAALLTRFGERLPARLLSAAERSQCPEARKAHCLARRFAAKEATLKALGTGLRDGMRWSDIEVGHDALGRPELQLSGAVRRRLHGLCRTPHLLLSLSDEEHYAMATVIIEDQERASGCG